MRCSQCGTDNRQTARFCDSCGGRDIAEEMLTALLGNTPALSRLKRLIIEKTEGIPFFVEEIVQALFEDGA